MTDMLRVLPIEGNPTVRIRWDETPTSHSIELSDIFLLGLSKVLKAAKESADQQGVGLTSQDLVDSVLKAEPFGSMGIQVYRVHRELPGCLEEDPRVSRVRTQVMTSHLVETGDPNYKVGVLSTVLVRTFTGAFSLDLKNDEGCFQMKGSVASFPGEPSNTFMVVPTEE